MPRPQAGLPLDTIGPPGQALQGHGNGQWDPCDGGSHPPSTDETHVYGRFVSHPGIPHQQTTLGTFVFVREYGFLDARIALLDPVFPTSGVGVCNARATDTVVQTLTFDGRGAVDFASV